MGKQTFPGPREAVDAIRRVQADRQVVAVTRCEAHRDGRVSVHYDTRPEHSWRVFMLLAGMEPQ